MHAVADFRGGGQPLCPPPVPARDLATVHRRALLLAAGVWPPSSLTASGRSTSAARMPSASRAAT
eukprot:6143350-Pleurochrysis_carterae.AAC.1